jgi:ribosomal protein S18 acetylase RimI-like enzyme
VPTSRPIASGTIVRQARESEWEEYRDLRLKALWSDPTAFGSTLQREEHFTPAMWKERINHGPAGSEAATWVAVDSAGQFVGTTVTATVGETVHLFAMWVDPDHRGNGIGAQLLDAALDWIRHTHAGRSALLEVNPHQVAAVRLYESRGFRRTGQSSPLGHTPGETVVEMELTSGGKAPPTM